MSRARTADVAQANRLRWFLAAHLLAVLGIFEASMWVGQHLAARPEPIPAARPHTTGERLAAASSIQESSR